MPCGMRTASVQKPSLPKVSNRNRSRPMAALPSWRAGRLSSFIGPSDAALPWSAYEMDWVSPAQPAKSIVANISRIFLKILFLLDGADTSRWSLECIRSPFAHYLFICITCKTNVYMTGTASSSDQVWSPPASASLRLAASPLPDARNAPRAVSVTWKHIFPMQNADH